LTRSERLLALLQALRRRRRPVSGAVLAEELGVSLRTLYRDIAALQGQGAEIEGEAGLGYVLKPGFWLPPLMLSGEEIEALVLGARWVGARTDEKLALAARDAIAKISAVLPASLREDVEASTLIVAPGKAMSAASPDLAPIRAAIRSERKLALDYRDAQGASTERTIWPFGIGYFDEARVVMAWCELRQGFRHFRADRIASCRTLDARYPSSRRRLLKDWRLSEGVSAPE
jgi:predicted DNA-binding transcriptional regulator YafY